MLNNTLLYLINELIGWAFSGIYFGNILSYIKFHIIFFFTILYLKKILVGREKGGGGGGGGGPPGGPPPPPPPPPPPHPTGCSPLWMRPWEVFFEIELSTF